MSSTLNVASIYRVVYSSNLLYFFLGNSNSISVSVSHVQLPDVLPSSPTLSSSYSTFLLDCCRFVHLPLFVVLNFLCTPMYPLNNLYFLHLFYSINKGSHAHLSKVLGTFIFKHIWHQLKSKQNKITLKQVNGNINIHFQYNINIFNCINMTYFS